jgi:BMFP domain-containing protein YqiC
MAKAPEQVVEKTRARLEQARADVKSLEERLAALPAH